MRTIIFLLAASVLLNACVALPSVNSLRKKPASSSLSSISSISFISSVAPTELLVEIEEFSSSSIRAGTGALAETLTDDGFLLIGDAHEHVLTVFTNFSCAYCREFGRDMLPRMLGEFVATGQLSVQIAIVPLKKYPNSALEASALFCAAKEKKGLAMYDELTTAVVRDRKTLTALAKKLALPAQTFATCLSVKETKTSLAGQQALIAEYGVTLIPTFLLGTQKQVGLPSYPDLRGWVREKLQ